MYFSKTCIGEVKTMCLEGLQNLCMSLHFFTIFPWVMLDTSVSWYWVFGKVDPKPTKSLQEKSAGQGHFWDCISMKRFQTDAICPELFRSKRQRWALSTSPEGQEQSERVQMQETFWPNPAAVNCHWRAVDFGSWNLLKRGVLGKLQIILTSRKLHSFGSSFFLMGLS